MKMTQRQLLMTIIGTALVSFILFTLLISKNQKHILEFPNKKASWFSLKNNEHKIADLGTKHFDLFINTGKEKYSSFLVFTQGNVCKVIESSFTSTDYYKFKEVPFVRQVLEIPTLSTDSKDFCKNKPNSHFVFKSMKDLKTVKKQYKRFNNEQEVQEFIRVSKSKKTSQELIKEMVVYEVLQMELEPKK